MCDPVKNSNLGMKFIEYVGKIWNSLQFLSFLRKMGLEFFSAGLEFFENAQDSLA